MSKLVGEPVLKALVRGGTDHRADAMTATRVLALHWTRKSRRIMAYTAIPFTWHVHSGGIPWPEKWDWKEED